MAPTPTSKPTTAPPRVTLIIAPIPGPPPGLTPEETARWDRLHEFRNTVNAIRDHLRLQGTQTAHLRTLTRLYYNQHVAGPGEQRYTNDFSMDSRLSRDKRMEENLHLATIGASSGTKEDENRAQWNEYLSELGFPPVKKVGTGLPDHLRCRDSDAARILMSMSNAAATPTVVVPPVIPTTVAETAGAGAGAVNSGEARPLTAAKPSTAAGPSTAARPSTAAGSSTVAGPSTAASRATVGSNGITSQAANEEAEARRASVEEAISGATEDNDLDLYLALQYPRTSVPCRPHESDEEAMTRLVLQFLDSERLATTREALIELVRAGWDVEVALNSWSRDQAEEGDRDDEGQPPSKWQRLNDDDDDGEEGDGGRVKGKGKQRAD